LAWVMRPRRPSSSRAAPSPSERPAGGYTIIASRSTAGCVQHGAVDDGHMPPPPGHGATAEDSPVRRAGHDVDARPDGGQKGAAMFAGPDARRRRWHDPLASRTRNVRRAERRS
jgi:hypothetical protein